MCTWRIIPGLFQSYADKGDTIIIHFCLLHYFIEECLAALHLARQKKHIVRLHKILRREQYVPISCTLLALLFLHNSEQEFTREC